MNEIDDIIRLHKENCVIIHDFICGNGGKYCLLKISSEILNQEDCNNRKLVSFLQLLSKLLKHNRSASHPEREIGKSRSKSSHHNIDVREIINIGVVNMHLYLHKIEMISINYQNTAIVLSQNDIFFIYSFVLDILKVCKVPKKKHSLHESYDDHMVKVVNTIVEHFEKVNIGYVLNYSPIRHKLCDIIKVLLQMPVFERNDTISFYKRLSAFIIKICGESDDTLAALVNNDHFNYFHCSFIENDNYTFTAHGAHLLTQIINSTLIYVSTSDINPLSMTSINRFLEEITTEYLKIIQARGIYEILKQLSEDDKEIISFLVDIIENILRFEYLLGDSNHLEIQLDMRLLNSIYDNLQECGSNVLVLFLYFITDIICYDSTVLLDLLISNETLALKYLLRVTSYLESMINNISNVPENVDLYDLFYKSLKKLNSFATSKKLCLNDANISTDSCQPTVIVHEQLGTDGRLVLDAQNWITVTPSTIMADHNDSCKVSELLDNVIKCLEEIVEKLQRFEQIPFQPKKLCTRLVAIDKELIRGRNKVCK